MGHDLFQARSCLGNDRRAAARHDRSSLRARRRPALASRRARYLGLSSPPSRRVVIRRVRGQHNGDLKAPFSLFLAVRYLKPKRTSISIITLISVLGVMLGITVLVVVISLMTGFVHELRRKVLGFDPHIVVTSDGVMSNWRSLKVKIDKTAGVVASAPFVQGPVIVDHDGRIFTPVIRGIDLDQEQQIIDLRTLVKQGAPNLTGENALVGVRLASALGITVGDKITIYAAGNIRSIIEELKRSQNDPKAKAKTLAQLQNEVVMPAELTVAGIFESGRFDYDFNIVFVPLHIGQELYSLGGDVHGISVKTDGPYHAES